MPSSGLPSSALAVPSGKSEAGRSLGRLKLPEKLQALWSTQSTKDLSLENQKQPSDIWL